MPTIAEASAEGAERLGSRGVDEPRRTAVALLGHALRADRTYLLTRSNEEIEETCYQAYLAMVGRRASGEPLQYITGSQEFFGLDFAVTRDVLIPRPETEFLVERAMAAARQISEGGELLIVDVGTGSGCIAVTLAVHIPEARVVATDISSAALEVARTNAERHAVAGRIEFVHGDLLEPLTALSLENSVDLLVSNPPYVPAEGLEMIQREVRDFEPSVALFGGPQGLDFYKRLLADGPVYMKNGRYLVCEIGYGHLAAVREMITGTAWELVDVTADLQGIPRSLTIKRR